MLSTVQARYQWFKDNGKTRKKPEICLWSSKSLNICLYAWKTCHKVWKIENHILSAHKIRELPMFTVHKCLMQ